MKRTTIQPVFTVKDIKKFENISPRVSEKYAPIFSTDLIKILAPEFKLVKAQRTSSGSTGHYVDMINDKKETIRIYNSYDRTLSFRMSLVSGKYSIDLGTNRVIHRGETASTLTETFKVSLCLSHPSSSMNNGSKSKFLRCSRLRA